MLVGCSGFYGSSPRARGTLSIVPLRWFPIRFIPAGAGNAALSFHTSGSGSVHPRGRGERCSCPRSLRGYLGSSPRARGTLQRWQVYRSRFRFIPAGAGNAEAAARQSAAAPVHPRGRGERGVLSQRCYTGGGSSPRARGTQPQLGGRLIDHRFIPAGAGNAPSSIPAAAATTVHPRGRGERGRRHDRGADQGGSSPRARGTRLRTPRPLRLDRFIPAGAGNASVGAARPPPSAVHPRGRGERAWVKEGNGKKFGSSPRARGTPPCPQSTTPRCRFIPAGAGNAHVRWPPRRSCTVHPRGRGERAQAALATATRIGSSPRARGTPLSTPVGAKS